MSFLVSPGVEVNEIDLTNVIPAVSTSIGGFVGEFRWGPVGESVLVSSEKDLANIFGAPTASFAKSFLTAASFLKYGTALKVSRAISSTAANASFTVDTEVDTPTIKNYDDFVSQYSSLVTDAHIWIARYPGAMGNGLEVYTASCGGNIASAYANNIQGDSKTGATTFSVSKADSQGAAILDEIHVVIVDGLGKFTGVKGKVLEVWEGLSVFSDALKEDGSSLFYKEVINKNSSYVYLVESDGTDFGYTIDKPASYYYEDGNDTAGASASWVIGSETTAYGVDGSLVQSDYVTAAEVFSDAETIDVNLLFTSYNGDTVGAAENELIDIANTRKDCVAFISAPISIKDQTSEDNKLDAVIAKGDSLSIRSSYVVFDSTPLYVYNKYDDTYVWIPACGHMAGLCANTDNVAEPWFSPAGYNRGNLLGITKLAFNPKQGARDELYKKSINPIVSFPGQGILLYGDKTSQVKPSAFDRINVRRLFIVLEKAIATAAKYQLFELNDEFTRAMFRNMVEPFLRDVKGRRGVTDFLVVCDETNNTGQVIDSNRFVADIYIKPARSINFISLNFIATRTGVEFSEVVGK